MNGLDLFTGSGAFSLALKHTIPDYRTICYVENEAYCQAILIARIADELLDDAPIWDDVQTFDGTAWRGRVDIITAGFPCQPHSVAGQRQGESDERNLWPDTARIINEVRPRYALLENVPGIIRNGYVWRLLADLTEIGGNTQWDIVSAGWVGAPYRKNRVWILCSGTSIVRREGWRLQQTGAWPKQKFERLLHNQLQLAVPAGNIGRVAVRDALRVDKIRMLGNGIVPQVVRRILQVSK